MKKIRISKLSLQNKTVEAKLAFKIIEFIYLMMPLYIRIILNLFLISLIGFYSIILPTTYTKQLYAFYN